VVNPLNWYLGCRIIRYPNGAIDQKQYLKEKIEKFKFGSEGASSPRSAVGSLMYAMVSTRPDIATAVSVVSLSNLQMPLFHGIASTTNRLWHYQLLNLSILLLPPPPKRIFG
jgi:hypothetical protein